MKLVECVPNFSEGRNRATVEAIANAIRAVEGVELLDVDPGADTNRTVVTFIGSPQAVVQAAFASIAVAAARIDMRKHTGAHARMGACDVCPLVPVSGVSMAECVALAEELGQRVATELGIPVYLYEEAARQEDRRNLASVRKGEYEGLAARLADPHWQPDFGPATFNARSGATVIGAREFLIAYNFNLNTRDHKIAHDMALEIREAGRALRDERGQILRDDTGQAKKKPGMFAHVKGVGWYMADFDCAQLSMNLTNYKATPLALVFDEVCRLAEERGVRCTGSELVGLIPKDCLVQAGKHFLRRAGKSAGAPERELIRLAVQSLGLGELYPFKPEEKIVEYRIVEKRPLLAMDLAAFADETSTDSPAPGGGSVAAACGALSAALASMAANLTVGREAYRQVWDDMAAQAEQAQGLKDFFLRAIDDDAGSFNEVMAALRLPKKTPEQKAARSQAIQAATRHAVEVPYSVLERAEQALAMAEQAVARGNKAALSDAGVSGLCARTAAEGAYYNVAINLAGIKDAVWATEIHDRAERLLNAIRERSEALGLQVRRRLAEALPGAKGQAS